MKIPLKEIFPDIELLTVEECLICLGWSSEFPVGDERGTGRITCSCGNEVDIWGILGASVAECKSCNKRMEDVTGLYRPNSIAGYVEFIDYDKVDIPEDGRTWVVKNG